MHHLSQVLIISCRKDLKVNKNEGEMKILIFFMLTSLAFAETVKDQKDCDPVKAGEVIDSFTINNMEQIKSVSQEEFDKQISILCLGMLRNISPEEFELAVAKFIRETGTSRSEFFSKDMFNYTCPNDENFLHYVLKRHPVNFERLISQEKINYPKDIPRFYKKGHKVTLLDLLNEFKASYLSNGWGSKFGLFQGLLRKLGHE